MYQDVTKQAAQAMEELLAAAKLERGDLLVIGCSSSEMVGLKIGKGSSLEAARAAFDGIYPVVQEAGVALAVQCCEHLNRALLCHHRLGAICPSGGCGAYPGQGGDGHRRYPHWDAPGGGGGTGTAVRHPDWSGSHLVCQNPPQIHRR